MTSKHYIAQISDIHLFGDTNRTINGANPYRNLEAVLKNITALKEKEKPELIIVSGDLSQDCTLESYRHLANVLDDCGVKYYLMPGNHDDVDVLNSAFNYKWKKNSIDYFVKHHGWFFYLVDTAMYPREEGELSNEQLSKLESFLKEHISSPVIVFMHHHPVLINSPWMDRMMLKQNEEFNSLVKKHINIKAVLFGHIHQAFELKTNNIFYGGVPSTSYQVRPRTEMFTVDTVSKGYRLIELTDTEFASSVVRVK